jgi:parallel beta-helix repeat protein
LRGAIASANPGDTINFADNLTSISLTNGTIDILNNLTITGPGAANLTIHIGTSNAPPASFQGFFFNGTSLTLAMSGLTITGGSVTGGQEGGAIGVSGSGNSLTLQNCVLSGNTAVTGGGAVALYGSSETLQVYGSTFSGNQATGPSSYGGAINSSGATTITISGSTFTGNSISNVGGAIASNGATSFSVSNSTFTGNSAGNVKSSGVGSGGAIGGFSPLSLDEDTFSGNFAEAAGGAIWQQNTTINDGGSTFTSNSTNGTAASNAGGGAVNCSGNLTDVKCYYATNGAIGLGNGGAIDDTASTATVQEFSGTFLGNGTGTGGGAIDASNVSIVNTSFTNNTAQGGGAIFNPNNGAASFIVSESSFTSNSASTTGGAIGGQSTLTLNNDTFTSNFASSGGGAVSEGNTITDTGSTFTSNFTFGGISSTGGAINCGGNVTDTNCYYAFNGSGFHNGATVQTGNGGAIFDTTAGTTVQETGGTFLGNTASTNGGAIDAITVTASNTSFTNNSALVGGAIYQNASPGVVKLSGGTFSGNQANVGGAVYTNSTVAGSSGDSVTGATFSNNTGGSSTALGQGGAIYDAAASLRITSASFTGNMAIGPSSGPQGGAIFVASGILTVNGGGFSGNQSAFEGGAIFENTPATITVQNGCTFSQNQSARSGGAIELLGTGTSTITGCSFTNNNGGKYGGAMDAANGTLQLTGSTLSGNTASFSGGAISDYQEQLNVYTSTLSSNTAEYGGGIFNNHNSNLMVSGSSLSKNGASGAGGAIDDFSGGTVTITGCMITGNFAFGLTGSSGGAIFAGLNSVSLTISNSTLSGNTAIPTGGGISYGGAIESIAGTVLLQNSTLSGNSASQGGAITVYQSQLTVTAGTVSNNSAQQYGGGIANIKGGTVSISGTTLSGNTAGGTSKWGGGAIFSNSAVANALSVTGCTLSGNSAANNGGAVTVLQSQATITTSTFTNNSAHSGGSIFNTTAGTVTITACTLTGNIANGLLVNGSGYGGAVLDGAGSNTLTMTKSTLSSNTAATNGGGMWLSTSAQATVSGCTFSGNSALDGGAIGNVGALTLVNTTLAGNTTSGGLGGGLFNQNTGTAQLTNVTIANNQTTFSSAGGGGIWNTGVSATLNNTLVAGNFNPNLANLDDDISGAVAGVNNLIGDGTGMTGLTNGMNGNQVGSSGNLIDPLITPLGNYGGPTQTMALLPGSPAIGTGTTSVVTNPPFSGASPFTDQRGTGFARIVNGAVDIGAFQTQGFVVQAVGGNNQSAHVNSQFAKQLQARVLAKDGIDPVSGGVLNFTSMPGATGAGLNWGTNGTNFAPIVGDRAALTVTANAFAGSYTVSAGTNGFSTSATFNLTNLGVTSTTAVAGPANAFVGLPASFTITVSGASGTPAGIVTLYDNGTPLGSGTLNSSGQAAVVTSALTLGTHSNIYAIYSGDPVYSASTSPPVTVIVSPPDFGDNFDGRSSLGANWQIPSVGRRFTWQRRTVLSGFGVSSDHAVSSGPGPFAAEEVTGQPPFANPTVQADVNVGTAFAVGVMARLQSNGDAYVAWLTSTGQAQIALFNAATDTFTILQSANAGITSGTLQFVVNGSTLSLYQIVSGGPTLLVTVSNSALAAPGGVGMFAWGAGGIVDNFMVVGT